MVLLQVAKLLKSSLPYRKSSSSANMLHLTPVMTTGTHYFATLLFCHFFISSTKHVRQPGQNLLHLLKSICIHS
ncbi:hypothetical protein CW304_03595 [Bacillus sp. UFRGS-B20]|nr:hypothetical protein CW304_03595 [Bacillus sp. UFRGS-B20]